MSNQVSFQVVWLNLSWLVIIDASAKGEFLEEVQKGDGQKRREDKMKKQ